MRAVVFEGEGQVAVRDVPDAGLTGPTSAVVRVEYTSICGSDLHFYWGEFGSPAGIRPGHEFIGTVVERGAEVEKLAVGDRVMAMALYGCGHCPGCDDLRPTACSNGWANFGVTREWPGGQAEAITVDNADHVLRKLPNWMTADQAVLMTDVLPTGCYAARNASIEPGGTVAVIGLGPIGLSSVANALTYQPGRVLAFDSLPDRRARAAELGVEVFDPAVASVAEVVGEATGGRGADSVIEAVGNTHTLAESLRAARVGGTVSIIGITVSDSIPISPLAVTARNLTLRFGTTDVPLMWERLFPLVERGEVDLTGVFTHRLPLTEAVRGYEVFAGRQENVFKVVFDATT